MAHNLNGWLYSWSLASNIISSSLNHHVTPVLFHLRSWWITSEMFAAQEGLLWEFEIFLARKCEMGGLQLCHACVRVNVNQLYCRREMWFFFGKLRCSLQSLSLSFFSSLMPAGVRMICVPESQFWYFCSDLFIYLFILLCSEVMGLVLSVDVSTSISVFWMSSFQVKSEYVQSEFFLLSSLANLS